MVTSTDALVDAVVMEQGKLPMDELYEAMKPGSRSAGAVGHAAVLVGREGGTVLNPDNRFQRFCTGDTLVSRNIHAAVFDALRSATIF